MRGIWLAGVLVAGCGGHLRDGVFAKDGVRYRLGAPSDSTWRQVRFADNDLAWSHGSGVMMSANATCDGHGDPSLEVLTQHLLFGFSERELVSRGLETLDGREALRSRYVAKLDGVPVDLELVVVKKNGCVHDFTLIAPVGKGEAAQGAFSSLVSGFRQEAAP
ncbi:MAG: hypothetical protein JNG84_05325 [Archangium sp.]|nr:hypothetical protein [Archangium sp.]